MLAQLERPSQAAGFIELHVDYCVAILQARKIGSRVTTFIGADRNRMIESFEDFVSIGGQRVFLHVCTQLFLTSERFSVLVDPPPARCVRETTRRMGHRRHRFSPRTTVP